MNRVAGLLRLEARGFKNLTRWRWVLINEADDTEVVAHDVRLAATDWQFEAFANLHQYLNWHVAPDRRGVDDARIVGEVGEWIGTHVLGPVAEAVAQRALQHHVTVRVVVAADAAGLLLRPLELAYVNGRPLAAQDVTLVMQSSPQADSAADVPGPRGRLRVLGLFSLPEGGQPLNLRRERQALVTLIRGIAESGKAADVRVLQYGVTRDLLRNVLADREGWDIIHVSGHGAPGELLLETADGKPDRVTAAQLADLLIAARKHVRLITVAACWSAADSVADQRRRLGLPVSGQKPEAPGTKRPHPPVPPPGLSSTLATELVDHLSCTVLAMRYPVDDDFAIALSGTLYELLTDKGNPLPQAIALTLRHLSDRAFPAMSLATPALFGAAAVGLSLAAPKRAGPADHDAARLKLAGFPPQPERFVGRTAVMARSSAALALRSGVPGILLHGMPGSGKTACALELAYGHEHAFDRLIWYKAPDDGMAIDGTLTDLAFTLEQELPGFQMLDVLVRDARLTAFLPRLTELTERRRILLVIDSAESLISEDGKWRDTRWGQVIPALTAHRGLGRVILTSRQVPADLTGLQVEAVDALSADEALLFARELPHLKALGQGKIPGIDRLASRQLARRALAVAKGHPKLLELADGQASHPKRLIALLDAGDRAWRAQGGLPDGFFTTDEPTGPADGTAQAADYWHVLAAWTTSAADALAPGERDLFWFLCCLEEPDRIWPVLDSNWADLWHRLGRHGEPPDLARSLTVIAARGLTGITEKTDGTDTAHPVHPGVAEAGRRQAGKSFRDVVDAEIAAYWDAVHEQGSGQAGDGNVNTWLAVRAGLAAVPYLLRQHQWDQAGDLLESGFIQDSSRTNAAAMLPAIEQITRHAPGQAVTLARMLAVIDPAAGEALLRSVMADADVRGEYRTAGAAARRLMFLCRDSGRLAEALDLAEQGIRYTSQAGLGPWTQLSDEAHRLSVLNTMGQVDQVLGEIIRLRRHMATLPAIPSTDEASSPWHVREVLLDTGYDAASQLGRHAEALAFNTEIVASMRTRRAAATDVAQARYNGYYPLLNLGRTEEALRVLLDCRQTFQDARDTEMLGKTLGALANTEVWRGHIDAALSLERDALRYKYLAGDVTDIAVGYNNLGITLHDHARQPAAALACHIAAALIRTLTGLGHADRSIKEAAIDLHALGTAAVPTSIAELCDQLSDIPGTDLSGLLAELSPDPQIAEAALRDINAEAVATTPKMFHMLVAQAIAMATPRWWRRRGRKVRIP